MNLYVSDIHKSFLRKSEGTPPTGGVPKVAAPKTPGAATGGSGPQIVDCPLGGACPDGGKHQMGSTTLQEHTAQAQQGMQTGQKPGDESQGKESGKPGVPPGASNIGGVGSDQAIRTPPKTPGFPDTTQEVDVNDLTELDTSEGKKHEDFSAQAMQQDPHGAKKPSSGSEVAGAQKMRPGMEQQDVPNPMVADEAAVSADSKPMDHYRLSQVAKESGDDELAKFHEGMARKRTEGMGSEDHRQLAEQLNAAGMHEAAAYHSNIHSRVSSLSGEEKTPDPAKHEDAMRDVHHEAKTKASQDLEAAKKKHEETKAKADKIRATNEEKLKQYESAKAEHEKAKAEAKATKKKPPTPPKKPELEKEPKVADKPELVEPANDADKLRHEDHTSKAKRLADIAESHLKGNTKLSDNDKKRLERAHKMAVYHANIGYTPTAAHKKELGDVEHAMSGMNVKQHHDEVVAAEDAKKTATAAKQAEKDRSAQEKAKAKQEKVDAKEQEKLQAAQPKPPQTDLDHARVADHADKAKKLKANILSHMQDNKNMSPEQQAKATRILAELDKHENMTMLPTDEHTAELKELQGLAGETGKKPYSPETETEGGESSRGYSNPGGYVLPMLHTGRALGAGLAASATSPYGAAGHVGPQIVSYGSSGAITAGHRLLHDAGQAAKDEKDIKESLDKEKDAQEQRAKQASRRNEVVGRGGQ